MDHGRISQSVYFWNMLVNHAGRVYAANPGSIHPTDPTINVHGLGLRLAQIFDVDFGIEVCTHAIGDRTVRG